MFIGARANSQRLRADVDNLQTQCANDMWSAWNNTNTALQQRVSESTEAHNKLQSHHSKTMQEIYDQARLYLITVLVLLKPQVIFFKIDFWLGLNSNLTKIRPIFDLN